MSNTENWFYSPVTMRQTAEVTFENKKKYKYRTFGKVKKGSIVFIGGGNFATSGQMGTVTDVLDISASKRSYTAVTRHAFSKYITENDAKKIATRLKKIKSVSAAEKIESFSRPHASFVDIAIDQILCCATALAYPEYFSEKELQSAVDILSEKKTVPGFMFGTGIANKCPAQIYSVRYKVKEIDTPIVNYTGYYDNWDSVLFSLPIMKKLSIDAPVYLETQKKSCRGIYFVSHNGKKEEIDGGVYPENHCIAGLCSEEAEKLINGDDEYNRVCNEIIYRSALSILIRGQFDDLLKSILSVDLPITDFKCELIEYANAYGTNEAIVMLESVK